MANHKEKVLDVAIKQEKDGIKFYTDAANKSKHHLGKSMFISFVEDEKEHLKRLEKLRQADASPLGAVGSEPGFKDVKTRLMSVFDEMKDELGAVVQPDDDDLNALKVAMDIEKTGHKLYKAGSEEATDPKEKDLFKFLSKEEIIHYEILKNTYNYLSNLDKLNAKDEDRGYDLWARMVNDA